MKENTESLDKLYKVALETTIEIEYKIATLPENEFFDERLKKLNEAYGIAEEMFLAVRYLKNRVEWKSEPREQAWITEKNAVEAKKSLSELINISEEYKKDVEKIGGLLKSLLGDKGTEF